MTLRLPKTRFLTLAALLCAPLLCAPSAQAQVGGTLAPLLNHPALEGRKPGVAGVLTLSGGVTVTLRQRGGSLTGVTLSVRSATPAGVTRASALAGVFTGYGEDLAEPLEAFLKRSDIAPRLKEKEGVLVGYESFEVRASLAAQTLTLKIDLTRVPDASFAPTPNALAPRRAGAKPVVLRVYSDIQCPYCQKLDLETFPALLARLPDDVRVEFHHFPRESIHPFARPAAEAVECAAQQGKFWAYKDALFRDDRWKAGNPNTTFIALAEKTGLKLGTFKTCLTERGGKAAVDAGVREAQQLDLNSTPTVFVDGYRAPNPFDVPGLLKLVEYARATR